MTTRKYDIIVWGSTGFTGQLTCDYLNKEHSNIRWAMAGRNAEALQSLKSRLGISSSVDVVVADVKDQDSIVRMVLQTKVLISTAGPYAKIGTAIVEACVKNGTHYCDITGEMHWVRKMMDIYADEAKRNKVKLVSFCGFDCVPCDIGAQMIAEELLEMNLTIKEVRFVAYEVKGGASGGTIFSMMTMFASSTWSQLFGLMNPFYLNPIDPDTKKPLVPISSKLRSRVQDSFGCRYDRILKCWTGPYLMQAVDTRVVNYSNTLQNFKYGRNFIFTESMRFPGGFLMNILSPLILSFIFIMMTNPITRWCLSCCLPKPGEGPSVKLQETGYMKMKLWGIGVNNNDLNSGNNGNNKEETIIQGEVNAFNGDPGYRQTAKFISESAYCLAFEDANIPELYGFLTPAAAFGKVLRQRLQQKNVEFKIIGVKKK